jgi:hypothetical protein
MLIGFILFGFGWGLVWQAQGKAVKHTIFEMPIWCSTTWGKALLLLFVYIFGITHLFIAIFIYSWIGILYWLICAIVTQFVAAGIFHNSRTKNPAPPFFIGIFSIVIGLIIILMNSQGVTVLP